MNAIPPRPGIVLALCALLAAGGCAGETPDETTAAHDTTQATRTDPPVTAAELRAEVAELSATTDPRTLYLVANDYATGAGVNQDQVLAEELWLAACERDYPPACAIYGSRMVDNGDLDAAARYLGTAAQAGVVSAIETLVELHSNPDWDGASLAERLRWIQTLEEVRSGGG